MCLMAVFSNTASDLELTDPYWSVITVTKYQMTVEELQQFHQIMFLQVAKQLKEQQMVMRGHRDTSMVHELNR